MIRNVILSIMILYLSQCHFIMVDEVGLVNNLEHPVTTVTWVRVSNN